jgi:hypothetical protein
MIQKINKTTSIGEFIQFKDEGPTESGKTHTFRVDSTQDGSYLGRISWFGRWRKYVFFPASNTIFEQVCMRDISEFIEQKTRDHRAAKSTTASNS